MIGIAHEHGDLSKAFESLTPTDFDAVLARATRRSYRAGAVIIREGRRYHAVQTLTRGWVRVEYQDPHVDTVDAVVVIAHLGRGAMFGDMSFLNHTAASASVIAETEVEVLYLDGAEIEEMIRRDASFAGRFFQSLAINLARRLRTTTKRVRTD